MPHQRCEDIDLETNAVHDEARFARRENILRALDRMQREDGYYTRPYQTARRSPWQVAKAYLEALLRP